jgi:hypothetical protein
MQEILLPNGRKITQATGKDSFLLDHIHHVAYQEKTDDIKEDYKPSQFPELGSSRKHYLENGDIDYFLVTAQPFKSQHAIYDLQGQQISGFGGRSVTQENDLRITDIYTVDSHFPTGKLLLQLFISEAEKMNCPNITLQPSSRKARLWYIDNGFEPLPVESHDFDEQMKTDMKLTASDYKKALQNLEYETRVSFTRNEDDITIKDLGKKPLWGRLVDYLKYGNAP